MEKKQTERVFYLDWLRVLGMGMVFLFHVGRYFDQGGWHVKNPQTYFLMSVITTFLVLWIMPLFFSLSSVVEAQSMERQTFLRFLKGKCLRLAVPLIFGIFVLVPHQVYIERVTQSSFNGSFISFLPHYFDGFYAFGGNFAWMGLHLWYLLILFLFAVITYPLFKFISRRPRPHRFFGSATAIFFLVPVFYFLSEIISDPSTPLGQRGFGGWTLLHYLCLFIIMFLFARNGLAKFKEFHSVFLNMALVLLVILGLLVIPHGDFPAFGSFVFYPIAAIKVLAAWFFLAGIIGLGMRYFTFSNRFLSYANEAVLPFYMLHQSVIVLYGYLIRNITMHPVIKYFFLAAISFVTVMVIYHFIVKRVKVTRFLFGMKI
ncbi:MAG TPA: acyltransferase family protein [Spirochaetota bacterium]